jgi:hypothetical protein
MVDVLETINYSLNFIPPIIHRHAPTENTALLLLVPLPSNGRCLQTHRLATCLLVYAKIYTRTFFPILHFSLALSFHSTIFYMYNAHAWEDADKTKNIQNALISEPGT